MCKDCGCKVDEVVPEEIIESCECSEDDCCVEYCDCECGCGCDEPVK